MQRLGAGGTADTGDLQPKRLVMGSRGSGRSRRSSSAFPGEAWPQRAARRGSGARGRANAVRLDRELLPPGQGQAVTKGGEALGRVQGGKQSGGTVPAQPCGSHPLPSASAPRAQPPRDRQLTNYGQGHLKTWPLQHRGCKGKRRQVGGHRDALRPLDGNRRCWLRRGTGLRAGSRAGARARQLHRTQHLRAEEAGGKKKKKEEKSCLLSCWCCPPAPCEEGKEGHGQPGHREPPAERRGWAWRGLRKGGGRLPSPRPGHRRFPTAAGPGKRSRSLGMRQHPLEMHTEEGPGP